MPNSTSRPLKVFLCHSSGDKPIVRELYHQLNAEGWIDAWLDEIKILPGQDWNMEIERAVEEADIVIVCLSTSSVDKEGYVQKELRFVLNIADEKPEGSVFVIPLRLDECIIPRRLRTWQWVNYFPEAERSIAYQRLLQSLKFRAARLGIPIQASDPPRSVPSGVPKDKQRVERKIEGARPTSQKSGSSKTLRFLGLLLVGGCSILTAILWPRPQPPPPDSSPTANEPGIGSTEISPKDGMTLVYVPEGEFTMGSDVADDEKPVHTVDLDAFWIDQTEVTNAMYAKCVDAGICDPPTQTYSYTRGSYYGDPDFEDYPVIYVNWQMAKTYCESADRRLPTEAEWEKAASGDDERTYPWGDSLAGSPHNSCDSNCPFDGKSETLNDGFADTSPVRNYPNGVSPYGAFDMGGNVQEWVEDWYDAYSGSTESDTAFGTMYRVLRGGAWDNVPFVARTSFRSWKDPTLSDYSIGFRCAKSATL